MNWVQIKLGINHIFLALISAEYAMEWVENLWTYIQVFLNISAKKEIDIGEYNFSQATLEQVSFILEIHEIGSYLDTWHSEFAVWSFLISITFHTIQQWSKQYSTYTLGDL